MRRKQIRVSKAAIAISALVLILVGSNLWWASRVLDAGITQTYARASQETTSELLTQTLAVLSVVARTGASREQVVAAARLPNDHETMGSSLALSHQTLGRDRNFSSAWPFRMRQRTNQTYRYRATSLLYRGAARGPPP